MNKAVSEDDSSDEWEETKTPQEARDIFVKTVFEFSLVILKLCEQEEKEHPKKYENKLKPSIKIKIITKLLEIFDHDRLILHYVNYVLGWKKYIDDRNDRFFLENDHIYPGAPKADIEFFRDLWRPNSTFHLTTDEKEAVYIYFDTMLHYCEDWKTKTGFVADWEKKK
jgi:hypothetical protein